ncbi:hypothetical protein JD844_013518 [Phrynosoma platyrhinos]|uniref:Receptor ligand binding region domain-containing protein n=1 Tax=Phrynosoma platyrhinos TaxID=52577 RepID=A0ABQ7TLS9_PHRPL|nr:hypothetical protein JD844_013518 [Phrynosoma platyrhinos]
MIQAFCGAIKAKCSFNIISDRQVPFNYYKPGDHLISGVISTTNTIATAYAFVKPPKTYFQSIKGIKFGQILPFLFTIHEINKNPRLLPNITLGYNIYENYFSERITYEAIIDLLSFDQKNLPNYKCGRQNSLWAVLEGTNSEISSQISTMLSTYKIPQVNYGFLNQVPKDKHQFPFFYRMVPNPPFLGITKLLLHFRWTWIGLIAPDNDSGGTFMSTFATLVEQYDICIAFSEQIPRLNREMTFNTIFYLMETKANVIVCQVDSQIIVPLGVIMQSAERFKKSSGGKVWIATALQDLAVRLLYKMVDLQNTHATLSFSIQTKKRPQYDNFDQFLFDNTQFGEAAFHCSYSRHMLSVKFWKRCKEKENLENLSQDAIEGILAEDSYSIYNAIQAVAYALHSAYSSQGEQREVVGGYWLAIHWIQPWQLHSFLENSQHYNTSMEGVYLDENGNLAANFHIVNWVIFPNKSTAGINIGRLERQASSEIKFTIDQNAIVWPQGFNQVGKSLDSISYFLLDNLTHFHSDISHTELREITPATKSDTWGIKNMNYWQILPFLYAIHEVNQDPRLLPNITLGYNIYESYFNERMTYEAIIDLLSPGQQKVPNYSCERQSNLLAVLEGGNSDISNQISSVLGIFKTPQKREREEVKMGKPKWVRVSSMMRWMLLIVMVPHGDVCGRLKTKCPVKWIADQTPPFNYYRPGDYMISGITATTNIILHPYVFFQSPHTNFIRISDKLSEVAFGEQREVQGGKGGEKNPVQAASKTVSYGFLSHAFSRKSQFPFLHQMVPKQEPPYLGIVKLLLHFRWTWIGLFAPENESGEKFLSTFMSVVTKNGVCIAFSETIPVLNFQRSYGGRNKFNMILYLMDTKANVIVCQVDTQAMLTLAVTMQQAEMIKKSTLGKVWIATALQDLNMRLLFRVMDLQHKHVSLSFSIQINKRRHYDDFDQYMLYLQQFGKAAFHCFYSRPLRSVKVWNRCAEKDTLKELPHDVIERILSQDTYSIYNAIQAMAQSLHAAYSFRLNTFFLFMARRCPSLDVLKVVTLDTPSCLRKESLSAATIVPHVQKELSLHRKVGDPKLPLKSTAKK